jgi:leader peptidase (prepilin peptidase)/N-methyltransferase
MSELSGADPLAVLLVSFVLGLLVGSFLNVVAYRLPKGESVVHPRSRCPACGRAIRAHENVPLLSWLWLRGRCRGCAAPISARYPALELATGLVFAAIVAVHGPRPESLALFVLAGLLIAAAAIDFDHHIIPDEISVGGLVAGLLLAPAAAWLEGATFADAVLPSLAGAALGFSCLWIVGFLHARVSALSGRTFPHWPGEGEGFPTPGSLDYWTWFPGMGFGDVKLVAMIGAFLGPAGVVETIVLSAVAGLLLGLAWMAWRRDWNAPFGFGPALALGAILVVLLPWRLRIPW